VVVVVPVVVAAVDSGVQHTPRAPSTKPVAPPAVTPPRYARPVDCISVSPIEGPWSAVSRSRYSRGIGGADVDVDDARRGSIWP
jgi:hypothetical protein